MSALERIQVGVLPRAMLNVIYGPAGVGKTNFAAQFEAPIFLSFDKGDSQLNTSRIEPESWADALNILSELYHSEHPYKTINIDTASFAEDMCRVYIAAQNSVDSIEDITFKWKGLLFDEFQKLIDWCNALHAKGLNINYLGHSTVKPFKDPNGPDYDTYLLEMKNRDLAEKLIRSVDSAYFINFDHKGEEKKQGTGKVIKGTGASRRLLHTSRRPAYEAKNRYDLPDKIEISPSAEEGYQRFIQHIDAWNDKHLNTKQQPKQEKKP